MISNQIIQTSIDELKAITKVDIYVFDLDGIKVAATTEDIEISREIITGFAASPADSQVVGGYHFLKVLDDSEVAYVLASRSNNDDAYMVGKIAVSQIQNLIIAYKERFDRNNFFQNLILDNLLLVDIYNRAQKLHIEVEGPRIVYLVETRLEKDSSGMELLRSLFSSQNGEYYPDQSGGARCFPGISGAGREYDRRYDEQRSDAQGARFLRYGRAGAERGFQIL